MTQVTPEALAAMNAHGDRSATELADAQCDVLAYASLVAVMVAGPGAHVRDPAVPDAGALLAPADLASGMVGAVQ